MNWFLDAGMFSDDYQPEFFDNFWYVPGSGWAPEIP